MAYFILSNPGFFLLTHLILRYRRVTSYYIYIFYIYVWTIMNMSFYVFCFYKMKKIFYMCILHIHNLSRIFTHTIGNFFFLILNFVLSWHYYIWDMIMKCTFSDVKNWTLQMQRPKLTSMKIEKSCFAIGGMCKLNFLWLTGINIDEHLLSVCYCHCFCYYLCNVLLSLSLLLSFSTWTS